MKTQIFLALAGFVVPAIGACAAPATGAPEVPPEIVAMLKQHLGSWRTEGEWIADGKAEPTRATWECHAIGSGAGNVCVWQHEWSDRPAPLPIAWHSQVARVG